MSLLISHRQEEPPKIENSLLRHACGLEDLQLLDPCRQRTVMSLKNEQCIHAIIELVVL